MSEKNYKIDATEKPLGRLAVEIAIKLRGKNKPGYLPYKDEGFSVEVENVEKMKFTGKKLEKKIYYHYTGYPGGLKETKMGKVFEKNPAEVLRKAVWGMLPKNKLRAKQIKRLKIS